MNRPKLDLRIRRSAKTDLAEIVDYLAERNPSAATRFVESAHHELGPSGSTPVPVRYAKLFLRR
jgi:plasmid stabilization system protein ParE